MPEVKMDAIQYQRLMDRSPTVQCSEDGCNNESFVMGFNIKKISALDPDNPTGENNYTSVPGQFCIRCGKALVPPEERDKSPIIQNGQITDI